MRLLIATIFLATFCVATSRARPGNNQAASSVLGQPGFTTGDVQTIDARSFDQPEHILVDPDTGKVYVSDFEGNRVLRFSSTAAYQDRAEAEAVFGQSTFATDTSVNPPTASSLSGPGSLALDSQGTLYVADFGNARVLAWKNASSIMTNGAVADVVLGQPNFTTNTNPGTAMGHTRYTSPWGIDVDADDNLYVGDFSLARILRIDGIPTIVATAMAGTGAVTDPGADAIFGQPDDASFGTGFDPGDGPALTNGIFDRPWGIDVDPSGTLWAADTYNSRVLRWDDAATRATGELPDGVLGQPNFVQITSDIGPGRLHLPVHVAVDAGKTLWIADRNNSRVVGYRNAAARTVGVNNANYFLGQPDLNTENAPSPTDRSLAAPYGIAPTVDGGLFVCDDSADRVLYFADSPIDPNAALRAALARKIKKLRKALKKAKRTGKKSRAKRLKKKIRKLKKRLARL